MDEARAVTEQAFALAGAILADGGVTVEVHVDDPHNRRRDEEAVIDLARSLEGLSRNAGKHAGGVVISPSVAQAITNRPSGSTAAAGWAWLKST